MVWSSSSMAHNCFSNLLLVICCTLGCRSHQAWLIWLKINWFTEISLRETACKLYYVYRPTFEQSRWVISWPDPAWPDRPDPSRPDLTYPNPIRPTLTQPDLILPRLASPCLTSPDLTSPDLASPGLTWPHLASPYLASPHLTWPHLTSPGLTCLWFSWAAVFFWDERLFSNIALRLMKEYSYSLECLSACRAVVVQVATALAVQLWYVRVL